MHILVGTQQSTVSLANPACVSILHAAACSKMLKLCFRGEVEDELHIAAHNSFIMMLANQVRTALRNRRHQDSI